MEETKTLAGQLLISMPGMTDPNFRHTVTYICEHSDEGALGIVINKPIGMELGEVLQQLSLETSADFQKFNFAIFVRKYVKTHEFSLKSNIF